LGPFLLWAILPLFLLLTDAPSFVVADVSAIAGVHGGSVRWCWHSCYFGRPACGFAIAGVSAITSVSWRFCASLRVLAFLLLLVALLAVLLFPASLLMPAPLAVLFVFAGAGILVIVGRTAGSFAVSTVSANACVSSGSVCLCGCWHSCYCWSHSWQFCCFQRLC
jgi:hypothetical protein